MKNSRTVLVCVTPQPSSEVLVKAGRSLAEKSKAALEVVSVLPIADGENQIDCAALENIYQTARNQGGETAVYFSDDPTITLAAHIAKRRPLTIVTGFPGERSSNFISAIRLLLPDIPISMVDSEGNIYSMLPCETSHNSLKISG